MQTQYSVLQVSAALTTTPVVQITRTRNARILMEETFMVVVVVVVVVGDSINSISVFIFLENGNVKILGDREGRKRDGVASLLFVGV
jgi:hypothetical protein